MIIGVYPWLFTLEKNDIDLPIDYISLCLPMIIRFYRSSRFEFTPISIYLSISNDYNHWLTTGVTGQNPPRSRCCATPDIWAPFEPRTPMWSCDLVAKPGCPQQGTWGMLGNDGDTMGIPWDINGRYHPHGGINGILMGYYWDTLW